MSATSTRIRAIRFHPADTVAVVTADVSVGAVVDVDGDLIAALDPIPSGHKIAIAPHPAGARVLKYGETIGRATREIARGQHVHIQNVESLRLPGPATRP
jgi:altronate dehydratase